MLIIITLAADELELLEEDELEDELNEDSLDELLDELEDELLEELDSEELKLLESDDELEIDEEARTTSEDEAEEEIDDETELDDGTEDLIIELSVLDDETCVEIDELAEDIALLELELLLSSVPAPQAVSVVSRQMIKGCFIGKCMVKFSLIIVMVDYTIRASCLYTSK